MKVFLLAALICLVTASSLPEFDGVAKMVETEQEAQADFVKEVENEEESTNRPNIFDLLDEFFIKYFDYMNNMDDAEMGLDNSTETGFIPDIEEHLGLLMADFCKGEREISQEGCGESPFMGCSCHAAFKRSAGGEGPCTMLPCLAVSHFWKHGAHILRRVKESRSLVDLSGNVMKGLAPISELVCQCSPELYQTITTCARNYDGQMMEPEDQENFREFMRNVKMEEMQKFMGAMTHGYCGNRGECAMEFVQIVPQFAAMVDRSCRAREENCNNLRRLSEGIWAFVDYLENEDEDHSFTEVVLALEKHIFGNFWCNDKRCAKWLGKMFNNNCCYRNMAGQLTPGIVKSVGSFLTSVYGRRVMPKFKKPVLKTIPKFINPNAACKRIYRKRADQCDALEAF